MKSLTSTHYLDASDSAQLYVSRETSVKRWFLLSLLLSTWMPMAFFISLGGLETENFSLAGIKTILLFLSTAHVPATLFFYTDKDFSQIIKSNKTRYIYLPLVLIISTGLVVAFASRTVQAYALLTFWAWQAYHYGRQNLGIYSFVSIAQKTKAPPRTERLALELCTICGVLGTFKVMGLGVAPKNLHGIFDALYQLGKYSFGIVIIYSIIIHLRNIKNSTLLKTLFFLTLVFFFLPIYLSDNINVTFFSYAIAHGLQYIIFMTVVTTILERDDSSRSVQLGNAIKLAGFILLGGLIFYGTEGLNKFEFIKSNAVFVKCLDFAFGAILGATMAHFVVDADAWRLRKIPQRAYMGKRFGFIFNAGDSVKPRLNTE